jgi:hyperosmotically inducible protein
MGNHFRRILRTSAVVAVVFSLLACTTTKSPGEEVSDRTITAKVKTKLTADRFSNLVNIEVNVTHGIVTLAGEVPNEQVKRDAEAEARTVEGVRGVNNNLQVSNPSRP